MYILTCFIFFYSPLYNLYIFYTNQSYDKTYLSAINVCVYIYVYL